MRRLGMAVFLVVVVVKRRCGQEALRSTVSSRDVGNVVGAAPKPIRQHRLHAMTE